MTTTEEKTKHALEIERQLSYYTGTEVWHRHPLMRKVLFTDGVKYLADAAESYWLIDKVASVQLEPKIAAEPFQVWRLKVTGTTAVLTATDGDKGDGPVELHREEIAYTDFPLDSIELWVEMDGDQAVILLPSEH